MLRSIALFLIATAAVASAKVVELELTLGYTRVNFSGRDAEAMAVNGSIPAPTLRFTEGDTARIVVRNTMREETSIHWHGLLVPNAMDGVPHVNMPPIPPGGSFTYEFRLRQTGTYWYHSHTVLQEQRGVYGGIVVLPRGAKARAGRDVVAVLSDWTDEAPGEVLRTLRRGSDWYSLRKGTAQSIVGAAQHGALGAYFQREWMRMPPMDFSDVAYDKFLLNGAPERTLDARPGETVRLRIINAAASTYFHLGWAGGPLRVIAADGQDVEPVNIGRFLMAIAETYDVLLTVPRDGAYEFRATAQDGTGHTSLFIGQGPRHAAPDVPKPNVYRGMGAMKMGAGDMGGMKMDAMPGMKMPAAATKPALSPPAQSAMDAMPGMDMSASHASATSAADERPNAPYAQLRSPRSTALPAGRPVREYTLRLQGDMIRYVWFINGKTLTEDALIPIKRGETVRFHLVNESMMHHPMHLHGHFFRVLNGQGARSPLKHTVDVPPMGEQTIEFDASEERDWMFHCHVLYHAKVGMARVVHYEDSPPNALLAHMNPFEHDPVFLWGEGTAMTHMTDGFLTAQNNRNGLTAAWQIGWGNVESTNYELELTYDRYVSSFLSVFAGAALANDEGGDRGILGVRYLLPGYIQSSARVDTHGDVRATLGKSFQITSRFAVFGAVEYDTRTKWEALAGAEYTLNKQLSLIGQWHSEFGFGGGLSIRF